MDSATSPPTDGEVKWSNGSNSENEIYIKIKTSSEESCNGTSIKTTNEKLMLALIVSGVGGFCLVIVITLIFVYYCKVAKRNEETEEIKNENPVYNAWDYYCASDNYVKDENICYD